MPRREREESEEHEEVEEIEDGDDAGEEPPAKRPAMTFKRGTVKKIRVHDFMTYNGTVTIKPGPRLNLVLGPNGTGKSSLVCALCVGMGGSTKLLGRADNLGDYVRRGCNSAYTEITLSGGSNKPDIVVRRDIMVDETVQNGAAKRSFKSEYTLNGAPANKETVHKKTKDLNIQFDNLCQFLPQDKVVEFAKMQPKELLEATEKALGTSTLHDLHEELKVDRKNNKLQESEHKRVSDRLAGLQKQQEGQRRDYERVNQRVQLQEQAKMARNKIEWVKVSLAKKEENECKRASKAASDMYEEQRKGYHADQGPIKKLEKEVAECEAQVKASKVDVRKAHEKVIMLIKEIEDTKTELDEQLQQQKTLQEDSNKWKETIRSLQREVQELGERFKTMPTQLPPELVTKREAAQRAAESEGRAVGEAMEQEHDLDQEIGQLRNQQRNVEARLGRLGDPRRQRLQAWSQNNRNLNGMLQVHDFMNQNRDRFRGAVYGPVALEINVFRDQAKWADYVEKQCGGVLFNFVTSCREDETILTQFVKENRYNVVVTCVTHDFTAAIDHPKGDAQRYQEYGITHTLDQVFDAPPLVKHMLCDLSNINRVYVGTERTVQVQEEMFKNSQVRDVFAVDAKISYSVSRYNAAAETTQHDTVAKARNLSSESLAQVEQERQALQGELEQVNQQIRGKESELKQVQQRRSQCSCRAEDAKKQIADIARRQAEIGNEKQRVNMELGRKQRQLQSKASLPDPLDQQEGLKHRNKQLLQALVERSKEHVGHLKGHVTANQKYAVAELRLTERKAQADAVKMRAKDAQSELRRLENMAQQAAAVLADAQRKYKQAKERADEVAPRSPEMQTQLDALPDDLEELEAQAAELQAKADAIACNDANVVQVANLGRRLAAAQEALEAKKQQWLPALKQLVETINQKFATNFEEIGCAGEVALHTPGEDEFDQYEIQIRVKFREGEPLQALTANRQSGGERSVSTILYLIALQGVTETPFRVVDEINQGMDPVNERKVFVQLVESSCKPDTPQCFMLTPKLLPGLPFENEITVMTIMNGNGIDRQVIDEYDRCARTGHVLSSLLAARFVPGQA